MQQVKPLHQRLEAIKMSQMHDPLIDAELYFLLQELCQAICRAVGAAKTTRRPLWVA